MSKSAYVIQHFFSSEIKKSMNFDFAVIAQDITIPVFIIPPLQVWGPLSKHPKQATFLLHGWDLSKYQPQPPQKPTSNSLLQLFPATPF